MTDNPTQSESRDLRTQPNRRTFLRATVGSGAAVALAGCTGENGGNTTTEGTTTEQHSGPIKLGVLAPLPEKTSFGEAMANGARLLATQVNDEGGLLGANLEVIVKDTQLDPSVARQKYRELVINEEVDATFGVFSSESHLAIIDDIAQHQTVHVAGGTGTTELNEKLRDDYEKYKYWFRTLQNGDIQGRNQGLFATERFDEMGWNDIALLVEDIAGYKSYARGFRKNLPDSVSIEVDQNFAPGTKDYRPLFQKAEEAGVDAVWIYASVTGGTAVNQWSRQQPDFGLGGVLVAASNPEFYENNEGAEYTVTANVGGTPAYRPTEVTTEFIETYKSEFGKLPPDYTGYTSYDSVKTWVEAVRRAGTLNEDEVVATIEELSFTGTMGTIEFYPRSHKWAHDVKYGSKNVVPPVVQWQESDGKGKQALLWPETEATGKYKAPPWVSK